MRYSGGRGMCLQILRGADSRGSVDVTTFVILSTLFGMLTEERLLIEGGCPCQDVGCATGVGQADERVLGYEGVLGCRQDKTEVAVLAPAVGTLD